MIAAFVAVAGIALARECADAKVVNFPPNITAAILFAAHGVVR